MQQNERKSSRTRSLRGKSPSGTMSRWLGKDYLKGTCNNSFCEKWYPPECLFYKTKSGCRFGEKCSYSHRQVDEQATERSKNNDDKSPVAILNVKGMYPAPHIHEHLATANCVHPHAQHEQPGAHCEQWHGHHKAH